MSFVFCQVDSRRHGNSKVRQQGTHPLDASDRPMLMSKQEQTIPILDSAERVVGIRPSACTAICDRFVLGGGIRNPNVNILVLHWRIQDSRHQNVPTRICERQKPHHDHTGLGTITAKYAREATSFGQDRARQVLVVATQPHEDARNTPWSSMTARV